jgi:hypothetical protein
MKRLLFILILLLFIGCSNIKSTSEDTAGLELVDKLPNTVRVYSYYDAEYNREYLVFLYNTSIAVTPRVKY